MKINLSFAQEAILNRGGLNHLEIELCPPEIKRKESRKPVLIMIVLDRSGSMGGEVKPQDEPFRFGACGSSLVSDRPFAEANTKMRQAINSTIKLIQMLSSDDLFGAVAFDDVAVQVQAITHVLPENQNTIINNIRSIYPGGCTNISQALQMARDMITPEHLDKYNCKMVVLSDGQANCGLQESDDFATLTLKYLQAGITVSALGIGYDYDSRVMNAIATGGGGLFYHVEDLEKLDGVFLEELKLSNSVRAKNMKLLLEIPDLMEVGTNMNDYKQHVDGRTIEVFIGDMVNSRKIYFEIKNNFVDKDVSFKAKAVYQTAEGEERNVMVSRKLKVASSKEELQKHAKDEELIKNVLDLIKYRTFRETSDLYEKGKTSEVQTMFQSSIHHTRSLSTSYGMTHSSAVTGTLAALDDLNTTYTSNNVSKSFTKNLYAESSRNLK